jgi:hypothetical protein
MTKEIKPEDYTPLKHVRVCPTDDKGRFHSSDGTIYELTEQGARRLTPKSLPKKMRARMKKAQRLGTI